ncbi:PPOX class F420-dependent oxidoreductase [Nonomuraea deserti]|uniref:PPOX class F420-dependent oxidoreductase n=1 Tax=Nonomuraea deserti TaxID=1848322 RepID=A0A4V2YB39_9ACTN|nr:PPOX class F420-dependent oxidoreductase [Nonomuraea deserti]TDD06136.1 PPOX class F420-dependent oxidoreductase [Nonomuraea deserti]
MRFTDVEIAYMHTQGLGRLATVQVNPVMFRYHPDYDAIEIGGRSMATTRKFRNLAGNHRVTLVIDDVLSRQPWRVRYLEVRGTAEQVYTSAGPWPGTDGAIIRIHPRRIISFGLDESDSQLGSERSSSRIPCGVRGT